ncbi:MAG: hypothetical protein KTR31_18940 [Myxococcales bacterium]|nr:hypothetical protein [Myxococcales bacterium]
MEQRIEADVGLFDPQASQQLSLLPNDAEAPPPAAVDCDESPVEVDPDEPRHDVEASVIEITYEAIEQDCDEWADVEPDADEQEVWVDCSDDEDSDGWPEFVQDHDGYHTHLDEGADYDEDDDLAVAPDEDDVWLDGTDEDWLDEVEPREEDDETWEEPPLVDEGSGDEPIPVDHAFDGFVAPIVGLHEQAWIVDADTHTAAPLVHVDGAESIRHRAQAHPDEVHTTVVGLPEDQPLCVDVSPERHPWGGGPAAPASDWPSGPTADLFCVAGQIGV